MGIDLEGRTKEEDISYEEEDKADGRKGLKRCYSIKSMLRLWPRQESTSSMSVLCRW